MEESPDDISAFWDSLDKFNRMEIWRELDNPTKISLLFSSGENRLDESQSKRLWDNIGRKNRIELWEYLWQTG